MPRRGMPALNFRKKSREITGKSRKPYTKAHRPPSMGGSISKSRNITASRPTTARKVYKPLSRKRVVGVKGKVGARKVARTNKRLESRVAGMRGDRTKTRAYKRLQGRYRRQARRYRRRTMRRR